jgi:hypothetical protein
MKLLETKRVRLRDILTLSVALSSTKEESALTDFAHQLSEATGLTVVLLDADMTLSSVGEEEMKQAGWTRMARRAPAEQGAT